MQAVPALTRRTWTRAIAALGVPVVVAACGAPQGGGDVAPPAAAIPRGTRVAFLPNGNDFFGGPRAQALALVINAWKQKTGIEIENMDAPNVAYAERLQTLLASNTAPDVVYVGGSNDPLGTLLLANALQPLDPLVRRDKYDLTDYFQSSIDQAKMKNALWGLPLNNNPSAMFVNRDLFTRAGLPLPTSSWKDTKWTWDDLLATGRSLTKDGADATQKVFGVAVADNLKSPILAIWCNGGDVFDKDNTRCTLDSPQAMDMLQFMSDLVVRHNVNPSPAQLTGTNINNVFREGRVGVMAQGQQLAFQQQLDAQKPNFPWGVAAMPRGKAGRFSLNFGAGFALTKGGKNPEAGWEWIKLVSSKEFLLPYTGDGLSAVSPRKSVMAEVMKSTSLPFGYKEVVDFGDSLRRLPAIPRWAEVSAVISKHFAKLWIGETSVRQIVSDIATETKPLLEPRL